MSKETTDKSSKDLLIPAKVLTTIMAIAFAFEASIIMAEPTSRILAVAALQQFSVESQEPNTEYLPISERISLAITATEKQGIQVYNDTKLISIFNQDVINTSYLIGRHELGNILRNHSFDPDYLKFMAVSVGQDNLPPELSVTLTRYSANFQTYRELIEIEGSGFARRLTPEQDIASVKQFIIEAYGLNDNQPIPSWRILEHWLVKNDGNYRESVHDAAISLEFLARNNNEGDFVGPFPEQSRENVEFYSKYIMDQSSLLGTYAETYSKYGVYNNDSRISAVDQIGNEYHNYIIAALAIELPAPYVVALTETQVLSQDQQAAAKSAADIVTVMDVYKLQQLTSQLAEKPLIQNQ